MLTSHDLAVIQAALMFANDELTPHGIDAWRPYCDRPLQRAPVSDEIRKLREGLSHCELRYGRCRSDGTVDGLLTKSPVIGGGDADDLAAFVALVFRDDG